MGSTTTGDTGGQKLDIGGGPKFDIGGDPGVPPGLWSGCTKQAPAGTAIVGQSSIGPFTAKRAFFGVFSVNGTHYARLVLVEDSADLDAVFMDAMDPPITEGPIGDIPSKLALEEHPFWAGSSDTWVEIIAGGQQGIVMTKLEISGHAGTWDAQDPNDLPRIQGALGPNGDMFAFTGPFDAVHCDLLDGSVILE